MTPSRTRALLRVFRGRLGRQILNPEQPLLWLLALAVGGASGLAAVGFVKALEVLQLAVFGATDETLAEVAAVTSPALLIAIPAAAGLVVGLISRYALGDAPPYGVAEVIEARVLQAGRLDPRKAGASTAIALLSLGGGASSGREGPAVVAGAALSTLAARFFQLNAGQSRILLGCAAAAAVSASFNAPIAGAIYALEIVLGHYAVRAFAPITIASVCGALLGRYFLGAEPAFQLPTVVLGAATQFPAFFLLGLISAGVAVAMMWSIFVSRAIQDRLRARLGAPIWVQPVIAGAALGALAIAFPHVLSVGYHTTTTALAGTMGFWACVLFAVAKTVAVAITLGGRFGGGVFSPALMLGALTGCAFGVAATGVFPEQAGGITVYALAGMGAVAGAVLGAPISTTLIVFEITGDYDTAIAVMVATSAATVATQQVLKRSFFHWQLSKKGLELADGPQTLLLPTMQVGNHMRIRGAEQGFSEMSAQALIDQGVFLARDDSLAKALPLFNDGEVTFLPVVDRASAPDGAPDLIGALFFADALKAYNRALVAAHEEEHS